MLTREEKKIHRYEYKKKWRSKHTEQLREVSKRWRKEHPEKIREYDKTEKGKARIKKYRQSGKGKATIARAGKKARSTEKYKISHRKALIRYYGTEKGKIAKIKNRVASRKYQRPRLLAKYGMTENDYNILLTSQGGRCAICGKSVFENGQLLSVDHDHMTGEVRSLLCSLCNTGIGHMERPEFLKRALLYLGLRLSSWGEPGK